MMTPHRLLLPIALLMLANSALAATPAGQVPTLPPVPQTVAPDYAVSGQVDELSQTILAEVPGLGPISSLDMLLINMTGRPLLSSVPMEAWLAPASISAESYQQVIRGEIERLAALSALASRSADWQPAPELLRRLGFDGAMTGYAQNVVANRVKVEDADVHLYYLAHPEKYLQRRRIDARYIYIHTPANADPATRGSVQQKLDQIAADVRAGKMTFEQAARRYSQAPSAASGGRLPTFVNGTYFADFEGQLLGVEKPGDLTQVFEGPGGYYLGQLIAATPAQNIPLEEVSGEIRQTLAREHLKFYYRNALGELQNRYRTYNYAAGLNYEYMNQNAPIARIGTAMLTRPAFLRMYENPVTPDFAINTSLVQRNVMHWLEGEMVLEEMESLGRGNDRYIVRARELGMIPLRARQTMIREIEPAKYSAEQATKTLTSGPLGELRTVLVAQIMITPDAKKTEAASEKLAAERQIARVNTGLAAGVMQIEPEPVVMADWVHESDFSTSESTVAAVQSLQAKIDSAPFPNIKIQVTAMGWSDALPNTQWDRMLNRLVPGQVSQPIVSPTMTIRYVLLAERPMDAARYGAQPALAQRMAWRVLTDRMITEEVDRIRRESAIKYNF
ncbi:peptidyl-prolyl cis-trans isomerase [bacterium]|nr:peptidyl-prolyl cis-trans isomerase [bacterium]